MERCPNCGTPLSLAIMNGQPCLVCSNCMNNQNNNQPLDMVKCEFCNTWFWSVELKCDCRKIEYVGDK